MIHPVWHPVSGNSLYNIWYSEVSKSPPQVYTSNQALLYHHSNRAGVKRKESISKYILKKYSYFHNIQISLDSPFSFALPSLILNISKSSLLKYVIQWDEVEVLTKVCKYAGSFSQANKDLEDYFFSLLDFLVIKKVRFPDSKSNTRYPLTEAWIISEFKSNSSQNSAA